MWRSRAFRLTALAGAVGSGVLLAGSTDDVQHTGPFRLGRAAVTVTRIAVDYKTSLRGLDPSSSQFVEVKSACHRRSAIKLRDLACRNGGCFIKVGQHLGALDYLLPSEYVQTLKVLHSDAPKSDVDDLLPVLREDLGKELDELFDEFETEPLGAASLAQVHKARLKDGTPVAVKIQYPRVRAHSFVDMTTMDVLLKAVSWVFPEFDFEWLAKETRKNLPLELDFINEGENCERVAKMLRKFAFLKVPKIHWELSSKRILTMEYCEGGQVNDKAYLDKHGICVDDVTQKLGELYSEMIFVQGYVHCDPHPGNVLVHKTQSNATQLVLLDHGLYQTLTDDFRINYANLWMSIIEADVEKIRRYAEKMNCGQFYGLFACMLTARSWDSVTRGVGKSKFTAEEDETIAAEVSQYFPEIAEILRSVPRQMLLLLKTNDLIRGIECTLKTRSSASSFLTMSKCCTRALSEHAKRQCRGWLCRFGVNVHERWTLFKLDIYTWYLFLSGFLLIS